MVSKDATLAYEMGFSDNDYLNVVLLLLLASSLA